MTRLDGWSLSPNDWQRLAELLSRVEWRTTNLNRRYQDSVPPAAGIYLLITDGYRISIQYRLPQGLSNVIYVGRSNCLRKRFNQHASESPRNPLIQVSKRTFGDLRYAFAVVPPESRDDEHGWLNTVESALVNTLSPPANRHVPHAKALTARLAVPQPVG